MFTIKYCEVKRVWTGFSVCFFREWMVDFFISLPNCVVDSSTGYECMNQSIPTSPIVLALSPSLPPPTLFGHFEGLYYLKKNKKKDKKEYPSKRKSLLIITPMPPTKAEIEPAVFRWSAPRIR